MKKKPRQGMLFPTAEDQPTKHLPGTPEKIEILKERLENGEELWHPDDRKFYDPDDKD